MQVIVQSNASVLALISGLVDNKYRSPITSQIVAAKSLYALSDLNSQIRADISNDESLLNVLACSIDAKDCPALARINLCGIFIVRLQLIKGVLCNLTSLEDHSKPFQKVLAILKDQDDKRSRQDFPRLVGLESFDLISTSFDILETLVCDEDDACSNASDEEMGVETFSVVSQSFLMEIISVAVPISVRLLQDLQKELEEKIDQGKADMAIRTLEFLNNIGWTIESRIPEKQESRFGWKDIALDIWNICLNYITGDCTGEAELELVLGLAWIITRTSFDIDISKPDLEKIIKIFRETSSENLQTKCIGTLGKLACRQGQIEINQEIGIFLMTVIQGLPRSPVDAVIESLDALFDIYADSAFDYDTPVFVQCGFLRHLQETLPKLYTMVGPH
ncbi:putative ARM-like repeat-containing protein [Neolecta irregularis DAH-3]|uniref:Putative ARM-like repeat-containing protein n=1 Tax=Neolecta irregularis (strain DAH-3) TaxID=1198029 RepID=A0A1U7LKH3_NEOID|nr:putative ARM-like repeat-containing protein [Neolecta irregularis DAH-3]|eukprot:OLL23042.1 putative ARM-like repeat-containing protein [Neolecta irregularis DAH-3]